MSSPDSAGFLPGSAGSSPDSAGESGGSVSDMGEETAALRAFARRIPDRDEGEEPPDEPIRQGPTTLTRPYTVEFRPGERRSPFPGYRPMAA